MPSLLEDSFADDLVRLVRDLKSRTESVERKLETMRAPAAREDMVLFQASSTGAIPAVTSSTTGVTPGKTTTAKQLSVTSTGGTASVNANRTLTVHNLGGAIAASGVGYAHREFATGRFVTAGAGSESKVVHLRSSAQYLTAAKKTTGVSAWFGGHVWEPQGWDAYPTSDISQTADWCQFSTTRGYGHLTITRPVWVEVTCSVDFVIDRGSTTGEPEIIQPRVFWMPTNSTDPIFGSLRAQFVRDNSGIDGRAIMLPTSQSNYKGSNSHAITQTASFMAYLNSSETWRFWATFTDAGRSYTGSTTSGEFVSIEQYRIVMREVNAGVAGSTYAP